MFRLRGLQRLDRERDGAVERADAVQGLGGGLRGEGVGGGGEVGWWGGGKGDGDVVDCGG